METPRTNPTSSEKESQSSSSQPQPNAQPQTKLADAPINSDNDALNMMVQFLNLAQRRGAFAIDESSKIYECFKRFQ
jgi:hypothetical protein